LAQFLTNFNLDRKYLQNELTQRKSEKQVIKYNPSHAGQKIGELWSTNQKVVCLHIYLP